METIFSCWTKFPWRKVWFTGKKKTSVLNQTPMSCSARCGAFPPQTQPLCQDVMCAQGHERSVCYWNCLDSNPGNLGNVRRCMVLQCPRPVNTFPFVVSRQRRQDELNVHEGPLLPMSKMF